MSLFGGDDSGPPSQTSNEEYSQPTSPAPRSPTPQNAQNAPLVPFVLDSNNETNGSSGESESESELEADPSRPNRFFGKPSTWLKYTALDRQIANSLEKLDSADLAAHLYNAHSLKQRVRKPAEQLAGVKNLQCKDTWLKEGEDLEFTNAFGETEVEFVPKRGWTAWPLHPQRIPPKREGLAGADIGDGMREEISALFSQLAKESWLSRPSSEEFQNVSLGLERSQSGTSQTLVPGTEHGAFDVEMQKGEGSEDSSDSMPQSDPREQLAHMLGKKPKERQEQQVSKPVLLADSDQEQRLLHPSVNSVLAQLDNLALAVRRSRQNQLGKAAYSDRSGSEFTSDADSVVSARRASSRSQSRDRPSTTAKARPSVAKRKLLTSKRMPKKLNLNGLDDSDSASDYGADHEENGESGTASSDSDLPKSKRSTSRRLRRDSDSSSTPRIWTSAKTMDWSEVLGIAAMTGWNERALARTSQRCAALFQEGMSFRTFNEGFALEPITQPVQYTPSTIPSLDDLGAEGPQRANKRPLFEPGLLQCPHKDCYASRVDFFKFPYRVIEHIQGVHGYNPRTNDSDNEERMYGGVHVDGFLQPIGVKPGWNSARKARAGDRKTRKGKKKLKLGSGLASPTGDEDTETEGPHD